MPDRKQLISTGMVAQNKKARFNYLIQETFTAGLVLTGGEVKSLRLGRANIAESYASMEDGELFLVNAHIVPYEFVGKSFVKTSPNRPRKLLLTKKELHKIGGAIAKKGQTAVPMELFFDTHGHAKIKLALAIGKNLADKRAAIKEREWNIEKRRVLSAYNKRGG